MNQAPNLQDIASALGATLQCRLGMADKIPTGIAPLDTAGPMELSFLSNSKYTSQLATTQALAVILAPDQAALCPTNSLIMTDPYVGFAKAGKFFDKTPLLDLGIAKSAVIHPMAVIGEGARIGNFVSIGQGVKIGKNCQIHPGCVIGDEVLIGDEVILYPQVVLYHQVQIGHRCIIHSTAVIGSDGFGLANDQGRWVKIPQLGSVRIGNDVEIGASTTIDRGALNDTVIEDGVKLDNQIQIGHNDIIGAHTAMAGGTMVAGSVTIGRNCLIGGQSAISGHLKIADRVILTGGSSVPSDLSEAGVYSSSGKAQPYKTWFRTLANLNRLDKLCARIKALERIIHDKKHDRE